MRVCLSSSHRSYLQLSLIQSLFRQGLSVEELKVRAQREVLAKRKAEATARASVTPSPAPTATSKTGPSKPSSTPPGNVRKDSSPVKVSYALMKSPQSSLSHFSALVVHPQPLETVFNSPHRLSNWRPLDGLPCGQVGWNGQRLHMCFGPSRTLRENGGCVR